MDKRDRSAPAASDEAGAVDVEAVEAVADEDEFVLVECAPLPDLDMPVAAFTPFPESAYCTCLSAVCVSGSEGSDQAVCSGHAANGRAQQLCTLYCAVRGEWWTDGSVQERPAGRGKRPAAAASASTPSFSAGKRGRGRGGRGRGGRGRGVRRKDSDAASSSSSSSSEAESQSSARSVRA
jgi:hypothetical protein